MPPTKLALSRSTLPTPHKLSPPPDHFRLPGWRRRLPFVLVWNGDRGSLRVLWMELALWTSAIAAAGYILAVSSVWLFLKYERGIAQVAFLDLFVPARWARHRVIVGEYYLALGRRQLDAGDARAAFRSLAIGVAKAPADVPGRIQFAQLLAAVGRRDLAAHTLLGGLPFARDDPAFLQNLFTFLLQQQEDETVRRTARELLADPSLPRECGSLTALAAATASYFRGNYDQADDLLATHGLAHTPDGRLLAIQVDWERGYHDLSLLQLRALVDEFPNSAPAQVQLAHWLRDTNHLDEFRRLCVVRQLADPQDPAPRIDFLHALRLDGETSRLNREIQAIFRDYARDEKTLVALADYAANTGDPALARRIYLHCKTAALPWQSPAFLTIEALIVARDYHGGLDLIRELTDGNPDWTGSYRSLLDSFEAIAHYGLGDATAGRLYLTNFLTRSNLRAENLLAVAQRLVDVGAQSEACEALAQAVTADPLNQAALTRLVELEVGLDRVDALSAHLRRLLAMRKPSPTVLRAAGRKLGSDLFLFSRNREPTLAALDRALATLPAN